MSSFVVLDSLKLSTPDGRVLADGLSLAFGRERTGLVGRNGAGKSTLLQAIAGTLDPAGGSIVRQGSVGLMRQSWPDENLTAAAAMGVAEGLARLRRLEDGFGSVDDAAEADWTLAGRLGSAMAAVGLESEVLARPISGLSGGERTRLAVAHMHLLAPDLLLLDEPTNNLDGEGQALIAGLIDGWAGGVVVAGHDRVLLEAMDRIVEIADTECRVFGGGWSAWRAARDAARQRAAAALDQAERDARQVERAAQQQRERKAKRDRAGRLAQAKGVNSKLLLDAKKGRAELTASRDGRLAERQRAEARAGLDAARAQVQRIVPLRIEMPPTGLARDRTLVRLEAVELCRGGRRLFGPLSFELRGPRRIALAGRNGAGKSSLLDLLRGRFPPTRGTVWADRERMALLDQHVGFLDGKASLISNLRRLHPALTDREARAALARFAFRNVAAERVVGTLSGGERLRAGLAVALSGPRPPQLLLLDEPTNHLDLESIEILEAALADYDGALLVASHDRAFLDSLGVDEVVPVA